MTSPIRRDLFFAYLAAGARVLSWVIVSAIVYRKLGGVELGILTLVRSTVGFLNYAGLGLAPALVHYMAKAQSAPKEAVAIEPQHVGRVLDYERAPIPKSPFPTLAAYSNGLIIAATILFIGAVVATAYSSVFTQIHGLEQSSRSFHIQETVALLGFGVLLRLFSDVPASVLQTTGRLWLDNLILAVGEATWVVLVLFFSRAYFNLDDVGRAFLFSGWAIVALRTIACAIVQGTFIPSARLLRWSESKSLLLFGLAVVAAQLADFLYAPASSILIHHLLGPAYLADYAPALQIDAGLLLLVTGIAGVLLPRAAHAAAENRPDLLRRYYIHGTLISLAILLGAAIIIVLASPLIFKAWLGNDMPETREILPWMLIHTVAGGASGVGRSILLGMGRVRAFTLSVLIAGVLNVLLSYVFVRYFGMGLKGIVLGTIVVVVFRCVVWQPAYVMKAIRTFNRAEP